MLKKIIAVTGTAALLCAGVFAMPDDTKMVHITSSDFKGASWGTRVLSPDTSYFLEGNVVVPAGWTLWIKAGTHIYCTHSYNDIRNHSLLIMAPNSRLLALGTADSVIVFTSLRDDPKDPYDMGPGAKGLWGGIIWCGEAPISRPTLYYPEGVPPGLPGIYYGGNRPHYNGGTMRFVSIRHGGAAIPWNIEYNGLSLYALGDSTEINNVEVFANSDDGFEFFGGTVNTKRLVSVFNNDDMFDIDEGHTGKHQFWFALEQEYEGDRGGEFDGKIDATNLFVSRPTIYNYTFIGGGSSSSNPLITGDGGTQGIILRDSMGGTFCNGIVTEFGSWAVKCSKQTDGCNVGPKPFGNSGDSIRMQGNIFYNCRGSKTWAGMVTGTGSIPSGIPYLKVNSNDTLDPMLRSIAREGNSELKLDPRPIPCSPAFTNYVPRPAGDTYFTAANYRGAFDSTYLWFEKWSALDEMNIAAKMVTIGFCSQLPQNEWGALYININMLRSDGHNIGWNDATSSFKIDGVEMIGVKNFIPKVTSVNSNGTCRVGTHYIHYCRPAMFQDLGITATGAHTFTWDLSLDNGRREKGSYSFYVKGMGN